MLLILLAITQTNQTRCTNHGHFMRKSRSWEHEMMYFWRATLLSWPFIIYDGRACMMCMVQYYYCHMLRDGAWFVLDTVWDWNPLLARLMLYWWNATFIWWWWWWWSGHVTNPSFRMLHFLTYKYAFIIITKLDMICNDSTYSDCSPCRESALTHEP